MLLIGDSVMLGAQEAVSTRVGASGWRLMPVISESLHTYDAPGIVDSQRDGIGDVVVISLGTNDGQTPGQFAGWIDDLMEGLRDVRRVYWVNLRQFADWVPAANEQIAAARDRWSNLRLIDWDARASGDPALAFGDGIHLTPTGRDAMAELVGTTLDGFAGEPVPTTAAPTTAPASTTPPPVTASPDRTARPAANNDRDVDPVLIGSALAVLAVIFGSVAVAWARRPRGAHSPGPRRELARVARPRAPAAPRPPGTRRPRDRGAPPRARPQRGRHQPQPSSRPRPRMPPPDDRW